MFLSAFLKNGFLSLPIHLSSDPIEKLGAGKEVSCLFIGLKIFIKHYMLNFLILSFHSLKWKEAELGDELGDVASGCGFV